MTFTQNFTSIEYNVTVAEQTDPTLGDGPAYLLNGVSDVGYWYQVGVSWDWAPGSTPGTGFDMSYEVFDNSGNSIFPSSGQGGLLGFSGPVNAGDVVLLNLYFSLSTQTVVMLARDTNTGASALESYSSMGGSYFEGLPDAIANQNGYFTGLMTEWYHGVPYYANEAGVIYSNQAFSLSSAWMWMDEFNSQSFQSIFSANATAPTPYNESSALQEFSFNGTTEYSDAREFVTGSLGNATQPTSLSVPLTISFTLVGQAGAASGGYSTPEFTYFVNGSLSKAVLTQTPTTYEVDVGTEWQISARLNSTTPDERLATNQTASGLAGSAETIQFVYYVQDRVTFGFSVSGGGSGFLPPSINYTSFGSILTTRAGNSVWADAGSRYQFQKLLSGSGKTIRWYGGLTGHVASPGQVDATYYRQFLVEFNVAFKDTSLYPGLAMKSSSRGMPFNATVVPGPNAEWLDSSAGYSVQQFISLGNDDRLATANSSSTGIVTAGLVINLTYFHQLYISINQSTSEGGTVSPQSGWFDSGDQLQLTAVPSSGWQFTGWEEEGGEGSSITKTANGSLTITVETGGPLTATALFYAGITVEAKGPIGVSYRDGSISGVVASGGEAVIYLPPNSTLNLEAAPIPVITSFEGWSGSTSSTTDSVSLVVSSPASVTSNSSYDLYGIGTVVLLALIAVTLAALVLLRRQRRNGRLLPL